MSSEPFSIEKAKGKQGNGLEYDILFPSADFPSQVTILNKKDAQMNI